MDRVTQLESDKCHFHPHPQYPGGGGGALCRSLLFSSLLSSYISIRRRHEHNTNTIQYERAYVKGLAAVDDPFDDTLRPLEYQKKRRTTMDILPVLEI